MKYISTILSIITVWIFIGALSFSAEIDDRINYLSDQIESLTDPKEKATNLVYRARQFSKKGDSSRALRDYIAALDQEYAGWILMELGYTFLKAEKYNEAFNASKILKRDFGYLSVDIAKLEKQALDGIEAKNLKENPPTLIMDTAPDPNRVSRHDLIKQVEAETRVSNQSTHKIVDGRKVELSKEEIIKQERGNLEKRRTAALENCRRSNGSLQNKERCVSRVKNSYDSMQKNLEADPEYYLAKQEAKVNSMFEKKITRSDGYRAGKDGRQNPCHSEATECRSGYNEGISDREREEEESSYEAGRRAAWAGQANTHKSSDFARGYEDEEEGR